MGESIDNDVKMTRKINNIKPAKISKVLNVASKNRRIGMKRDSNHTCGRIEKDEAAA